MAGEASVRNDGWKLSLGYQRRHSLPFVNNALKLPTFFPLLNICIKSTRSLSFQVWYSVKGTEEGEAPERRDSECHHINLFANYSVHSWVGLLMNLTLVALERTGI